MLHIRFNSIRVVIFIKQGPVKAGVEPTNNANPKETKADRELSAFIDSITGNSYSTL